MQNQRVVCAANKLSDGTVILGVRHWDDFMHQALDSILKNQPEGTDEEVNELLLIQGHQQGFIDQFGNFLTRKEAWVIAKENGQVIHQGPGYSGPELYSENLY